MIVDFMPEGVEDFKDMYLVQSYQMICQRLSKKGLRMRQHKYTEMKAS